MHCQSRALIRLDQKKKKLVFVEAHAKGSSSSSALGVASCMGV